MPTSNRFASNRVVSRGRKYRSGSKLRSLRRSLLEQLEPRVLLTATSEVEVNDTFDSPTALVSVEDPAGSGYYLACGDGAISGPTDVDYWSFEAVAGDTVAIRVDSDGGSLNPYVELRNAADGYLTGNSDSGPGVGAFISHFEIGSSGTYFARVYGSSSTVGDYTVGLDIARGMDLESDGQYNNDTLSNADPVTFEAAGISQVGSGGRDHHDTRGQQRR